MKVLSGANIVDILESLLLFLGPDNSAKFVKNAVQAELRDGGMLVLHSVLCTVYLTYL